jgi:gliding motility-associated-like protein
VIRKYLFLSILFLLKLSIWAQCDIQIHVPSKDICLGDTIPIEAVGGCGGIFHEDFNDSNLTNTGMQLSSFATYGTPCKSAPDLSPYLWIGMNANGPHQLSTPSMDLSLGAIKISFDIVYGVNGAPSPCDGPANLSEAVNLEYSIDGGISWTSIKVYDPMGGDDSIRTNWQHEIINLPAAAKTPNTMLRWYQQSNSAINTICWGIDNIFIYRNTNYVVLWSDGITTLSHPNIAPTNNTTYWVTIKDLNSNYRDSASIDINVHVRPVASFVVSQPRCKNQDITFTYTGSTVSNGNYNWNFPNGTITSGSGIGPINVKWNQSGNVDIDLEVSNGMCTSYPYSEEILITPLVSFYASSGTGCEPHSIDLKDNSSPKFSNVRWEFGNGDFSTDTVVTYTYQEEGNYTISLIVNTNQGCSDTFHLHNYVQIHPKPEIDFITTPSIIPLSNPTLTIQNNTIYGDTWEWDFGDGNSSNLKEPQNSYSTEGDYTVLLKATSSNNCIDTLSKKVKVVDDDYQTYNVITPNNDGYNDVFQVNNVESLLSCKLLVYNRWGKLIYENNNYDNTWTGANQPDGVYFFVIEYESYFEEKTLTGTVHILKN